MAGDRSSDACTIRLLRAVKHATRRSMILTEYERLVERGAGDRLANSRIIVLLGRLRQG